MKKKLLCWTLSVLLLALPALSLGANSRQAQDIPEIRVITPTPQPEVRPAPPRVEETPAPLIVEFVPDPEEVIELQEEMRTVFHLTISYVYANGAVAAPAYGATLSAGSSYGVASPSISGYTASTGMVSGVMPARDVSHTVIYMGSSSQESEKNEDPFDYSKMAAVYTLEDYGTPLGLGFTITNLGLCAE